MLPILIGTIGSELTIEHIGGYWKFVVAVRGDHFFGTFVAL